jgi:hypothetical protein
VHAVCAAIVPLVRVLAVVVAVALVAVSCTSEAPGSPKLSNPTTLASGGASPGVVPSPTAANRQTTSPPGPQTPGPESSALAELLAYAPNNLAYLEFTDWAALRQSSGHPDVASPSAADERLQTYSDIVKLDAFASNFATDTAAFDTGGSGPSAQAQEWGFDALDLALDATMLPDTVESDEVLVLKLRPGFDLGPIIARFDERGFIENRSGTAFSATLEDRYTRQVGQARHARFRIQRSLRMAERWR